MEQIRGLMSMRVFILLVFAVPGLLAQAPSSPDSLSKAEDLYRRADYQASLTLVRESGQSSARAESLTGRDRFMLGDYKRAAEAFERAVALEPANPEYVLWLGRSFGRRAETSSFLAPKYDAKALACFEKAVALDPTNGEALNDLFDYYLEAPGFLGGGFDKAQAIAKRIAERNPAEGHLAQARLADRRKQFDTAEEQLRWAIHAAPRQVARVLDLARYLAKQGRITESEAAFDQAERLAPNSPKVRFTRAQTYIEQKRNLDQARTLLHQYLESNLAPGDPPREQAEQLLNRLLKKPLHIREPQAWAPTPHGLSITWTSPRRAHFSLLGLFQQPVKEASGA
jgi:Flp pilus assembly protein TadD